MFSSSGSWFFFRGSLHQFLGMTACIIWPSSSTNLRETVQVWDNAMIFFKCALLLLLGLELPNAWVLSGGRIVQILSFKKCDYFVSSLKLEPSWNHSIKFLPVNMVVLSSKVWCLINKLTFLLEHICSKQMKYIKKCMCPKFFIKSKIVQDQIG